MRSDARFTKRLSVFLAHKILGSAGEGEGRGGVLLCRASVGEEQAPSQASQPRCKAALADSRSRKP